MKLCLLPLGRSVREKSSGCILRGAWLTALLLSMFFGFAMAPAVAQQGAYYYADGKGSAPVPLPPAANFVAARVAPNASINDVLQSVGNTYNGAPQLFSRRRIVLIPGANAAQVQAIPGVQRTFRTFQNGSLSPIIETDEILVRFKPGVSSSRARGLLLSVGASLGAPIGSSSPNGFYAYINDNTTAITAANALHQKAEVVWAQPNFIWEMQKRFTPNDALFATQWHLNNTGQGGGVAGADIKAAQAWDLNQGVASISIAVVDSGIDTNHEDLRGKIVAPRDVVDDDNDPSPSGAGEDHGTAVAGLAAASGSNMVGVAGAAPGCSIMPIRLVVAGMTLADQIEAFRWAADNGAAVICNSWGPTDGLGIPQPIPISVRDAIDYAATSGRGGKGCVILFASGNGNESVDLDGYASYNRVIAVGSSSNRDFKSSFSDFGNTLDLVAPGGEFGAGGGLVTTDVTGAQGYVIGNYVNANDSFVGTSAACPIAAGVAALVLSRDRNLTSTQVQLRLQNTADKIDTGAGAYNAAGHSTRYGYGRINAFRALQATIPGAAFSIEGRVLLADGSTPVPGVLITADRFGVSMVTDANGYYKLDGLPAGQTNVIPSDPNYVFNPTRRQVTLGPSARFVSFTAQPIAKVTLISPPADAVISTSTYPLIATTANNGIVQRVNFDRSGQPVQFGRAPNRPLPDATTNGPSTITENLAVGQTGDVASLSVNVNISHPNVRDLVITLITPDGRRIPLYANAGFGTSLVTTFENVPVGPTVMNGLWRLEVSDTVSGFFGADADGTLVSWGLTMTPWVNIGTDDRPNAQGEWTDTWIVPATPPGTYLVRAVAVAPGPVQEDVHNNIIIPQPSIDLLSPQADSTISGLFTLRARGENTATIRNVEFWQRRAAQTFERGSASQPLNIAIPDRTTITDTLTVPGGGVAERATLTIDVFHQFVGDLKISLVMPNGQTLPIFEEPTNGTNRLRRSFSLPSLAGKPFSGKYTLQIEDKSIPDIGRLLSWSLNFQLPWTLLGTDGSPNTAGIYARALDTQTLARGVYDFRAVAVTARETMEDVHSNVTVNSSTLPTYTISGVVRRGTAPLSGVTITRTGGNLGSASVTTNSRGEYTLPAAPNGDYFVTPSLSGHSFVPFNQKVRILDGEAINVNFTAIPGITIRGRITDNSGAPLEGIALRRSGSPQTQITDADGYYQFPGLTAGTYTITPEKEGYGFAPLSRQVRLENTNVLNVDFTGAVGYFIKGTITTSTGAPIANVRVARTASVSTTTNSRGEFVLSSVPNGSFYVTPSREGFTFAPTTRRITVNGAGVSGVNFIGLQGVTLSGRVTTATGSPLSGVRVTRQGIGVSATATTNAAGQYTFTQVPPGTHSLRPVRVGSAFTPTARSVTVSTASLTNLDFRATPDTERPTLTVTQPTARIYRQLALATGTASDNLSGVAKVTGRLFRAATASTPAGYWAGGNNWTVNYSGANELTATGKAPWVLHLPALPTGNYTFRATAWDNAGNRTLGAVIGFTMDTTAPVVQVQSPVSTSYSSLRPVTALGTAQDGQSGLAKVTVRLFRAANGSTPAGYWAGGSTWTTTYIANVHERLASGTSNWAISLPSLGSGSYSFRATAHDRAGNAGSSAEIGFTIGASRSATSAAGSLMISDVVASSQNDTVTLLLATNLNTNSVVPTNFAVEVNGRPAAVEGVIFNGTNRVTLTLPEGALAQGGTVNVSWSGLQTTQGAALRNGNTTAVIK